MIFWFLIVLLQIKTGIGILLFICYSIINAKLGESVWKDTYFVPVCCFILYNFGDYLGKEAATRSQWPKQNYRGQIMLLSMAILRIGFIPLFMYCNVAPHNRSTVVRNLERSFRFSAWGNGLYLYIKLKKINLPGLLQNRMQQHLYLLILGYIWIRMVVHSLHRSFFNFKWLYWKYCIYAHSKDCLCRVPAHCCFIWCSGNGLWPWPRIIA